MQHLMLDDSGITYSNFLIVTKKLFKLFKFLIAELE